MTELNMERINKRIKKTISMEEALKDVVPVNWSEEVLSGQRQVVVTNMQIQEEEGCVRLETSYL